MIEPVSKDKCLPEILALFPDLIAHRTIFINTPTAVSKLREPSEKSRNSLKTQCFL